MRAGVTRVGALLGAASAGLVGAACGGERSAPSCAVPNAEPQGDFECSSCTPETLYTSTLQPWNVASDGEELFFTERDPNGGPGRIASIPLAGGPPVTVAGALASPDDVIVDGNGVYWSTNGDSANSGTVMAMPRAGGAPTALAAEGRPSALALDGCNVYWSNGGEISAVPRGGGGARVLAQIGDGIACLAVTSSELLAMGNYGLRHVALDGSGVTSFETTTQAESMAVSGSNLYLLYMFPDPAGAGQVECRPLGGSGDCRSFHGTPTHGYAESLALDGVHVWWLDWGAFGGVQGTVARVPLEGGAAEVVVAPAAADASTGQGVLTGPHSIAVTPSGVFWIEGNRIRALRH